MKRFLVIGVALLGVLMLATSAASASTVAYGSQTLTPQAPTWIFSDSNGKGGVQVSYNTSPYYIALGYKLSPSNISICTGPLNETIDLYNGSKNKGHDSHPDEACDYQAHPSFKVGNVSSYQMRIHEVFRVNVGGQTGTATLDATANFTITLV